jgi:PD-(D/E)XK nuclease superfamily
MRDYFRLDNVALRLVRQAASERITQSEIMTRAACPRKWFYRYALRLDRKAGISIHLAYGSMMHAALAELYKSGMYGSPPKEYPIDIPMLKVPEGTLLTPTEREELSLARAKVQIAFDAYRWHYHKKDSHLFVKTVEQDYEVEWKGLWFTGRIDMVANPNIRDGTFIWDWKTAGRFDANMLEAWSFRFQFLYYCWLYWKATKIEPSGVMVNGLAKTQLRPKIVNKKTKEKETRQEYLKRVKTSMLYDREKFFYRQRMPLGKDMMRRFEEEMLEPHVSAYKLLRTNHSDVNTNVISSLAMAMNTGHCHIYNSFCEYLPLCKDGNMMLGEYNEREVKHRELEETEVELGTD